jgi:amicoumacin kinase
MDEAILTLAAGYYATSPAMLKPLTGGHFSQVYEFSRDGVACVLRIIPPDEEIDINGLRAIQAWMSYLSDHGALVSRPVPSTGGRFVEVLTAEGGPYLVVAAEKAPGVLAEEIPREDWDSAMVAALGSAVGKMHALARGYVPVNKSLVRPRWDQIGNCFNPGPDHTSSYPQVVAKREEVLEEIEDFLRDNEHYGLIHADLHFANFYVDLENRSISLFDFDDCCYGWYSMDTAMLLFDLAVVRSGEDIDEYATQFLGWYLKGYNAENPVDRTWLTQIPKFLKLLETSMFVQLNKGYDPEDKVSWVGKFMSGREGRIEAGQPYLRLDLEYLSEGVRT